MQFALVQLVEKCDDVGGNPHISESVKHFIHSFNQYKIRKKSNIWVASPPTFTVNYAIWAENVLIIKAPHIS